MWQFKKPDRSRTGDIFKRHKNMQLQSKSDTCSAPMYFLRLEKNQIQKEHAPNILVTFILQAFIVSERKSLPVLFLLTIQHSSDIILPKYINIIGSRNIWVNSPDICKTFQIFRKWTKDKKNREVHSQHQEPNDQLHHRHSQDNDIESHASTSEDICENEGSTTSDNSVVEQFYSPQRLLTSTETEAASNYTSVDNTIVQMNNILNEGLKFKNYCGLRNQGATCYLNAVLQTLFMTEEFRNAVMELKHNGKEKESVSLELENIFECLGSNSENVTTCGMTKALNIRNVHEQQDAAEYLQKILSEIEPETAKIFQGKKKHSTICLHSHHEHIEEINSFFSLAIDLDQYEDMNVQNSFNALFKEMLMNGEDQLFCVNCNTMTDMEMKYTILELPEVLTLHLKRFYLDYNYMTYRKNNRRVQIPLQLSAQEESGVHHIYDLYALVHHSGSLSGGHYYADIKSFEDQQWYQFNDSWVHRIQKHYDVRHSENSIVSDAACLIFFRKSNALQEKADINQTFMASDECEGPQTMSTDIQIRINPENSCIQAHQHSRDTDRPDENDQDFQSTVRSQSGTSDMSLKGISETDTGLNIGSIMDEQPEDEHQSPAEIQGSGRPQDTFSEDSESETPQKRTQRSNTWPTENNVKLQRIRRYSECRSPQTTSTDIQIRTNSCVQPHQHTGHTDGPDETHHDSRSTARDDEDQQNLLNKPSQTPTDESAADRVENYTRNYSESETETGQALFADRKVPQRRFLEECPSTRKIVCVGLIILSLVCALIFILVFKIYRLTLVNI